MEQTWDSGPVPLIPIVPGSSTAENIIAGMSPSAWTTRKAGVIQTGEFYDGRIKRNKLGKLEQEFHNPRDSRILQNTIRSASSFSNISPYVTGLVGNFRYVQRA